MVDPKQQLDDKQRAFCERAVADAKALGDDTAVLLVGGRAAGYVDSWSDLDLWLIGDKDRLPGDQRDEHDRTGQVFVDRGDLEAHYSFYARRDVEAQLLTWRDEMLWLIRCAQPLHDPAGLAADLKDRFREYPRDVLERKLRWWLVTYWARQGRLGVAGRGRPVAAVMVAGECINALCKMCCLADGVPFPYLKWLRRAAAETRLGETVCPVVDRAVARIQEIVTPPEGKDFRELVPLKELRWLKTVLPAELRKLGWTGDWVDNPGHYVWVLFNRKDDTPDGDPPI